MTMHGRRYGGGRLERGKDYGGDRRVYFGVWTGANGRRHRQILSSDRRVAERALAKIVRERDLQVLGLMDEQGQYRWLQEIREKYLRDMTTWASKGHLRRVKGILERLLDDLGPLRVVDLRKDRLLVYRQKRIKQGKANRSVNLEIGTLRAMLNWALECGLIGRNLVANLKPLPSGKAFKKRPRRALSRDEMNRLLEAAERIDAHLNAYHGAEKYPTPSRASSARSSSSRLASEGSSHSANSAVRLSAMA